MSKVPVPNANVPQMPRPMADVGSLVNAAQAMKQGLDSLAGNRGSVLDRAVTFRDLIALNILSQATPASTAVTTVVAIPGDAVKPYNVVAFVPDPFTSGRIAYGHQFPTKVVFPAHFNPIGIGMASTAGAFVAATGTPVLAIQRCLLGLDPTAGGNWVTIGTATFSGTTATLDTSTAAAVVFAAGDRLRLQAPATADATLSQFFMCLTGSR